MTSKQPLFSIITVVYNDVAGLALTTTSIASQVFSDFEWIVIDGGSTDGTVEFLAQCDQASLCWVSEKDKGIYDAMNKGISRSTGEYLVFLNAGDAFPNVNALLLVSNALDASAKPDVLFGGAEYIFADAGSVYRPPRDASKYIWHGLPANHQATYYSRKFLNGLLYDVRYKICGDYYLIAKLYTMGFRATYLDKPLVKFSVGGTSYQNRVPLFLEPYVIQRDVLKLPFALRAASFLKRGISTIGMSVLQNLHRVRRRYQRSIE